MRRLFYLLIVLVLFSCDVKIADGPIKIGRPMYAKNFSMVVRRGYIELHIFNPKTREIEAKYALVKDKKELNLPENIHRIDIPIKHIGAYSTTFIGMIDALGEIETISATTSSKYIYNQKVKQGIQKRRILTSDFDGSDSPGALLKKDIHLLMYSGFGNAYPNEDKLKQLGIVCMANYDWEETHPLGKAEWIKLFGALYDKSEEANRYFEEIRKKYLSLKNGVVKSGKKVIVGSLVGDIWYASAGKSYQAGIMNDAGLDYIYKNTDGTGSNSYTLSQIIRDESVCSAWLNAEARSMDELLKSNPKFSTFKTVRQKQVYSYLGRTNYFWEYSSLHPEWLLEDFIAIGSSSGKKMHFYQQLK